METWGLFITVFNKELTPHMTKNQFVSPPGIAKYPHLIKPDTKGQYATGKFTTKLVMTPEAAAPFIAKIDKAAANHKVQPPKLPYRKEMIKDGETKKPSGMIEFSISSKFPPLVMDFKNRTVPLEKMSDQFDIGPGSLIVIAGDFWEYEKGISLQIRQVQVIDLVAGRGSMFGETEGTFDMSDYEAEGVDAAPTSFAESNDNSLGI